MVWGCLLAAAVGALLVGAAEGVGGAIVVVPLAAGAVGALVLQRGGDRRTGPDHAWSASGGGPPLAPAPRPPASTWGTARALGRVEARELLASGSFGVGLGFCALLLLLFGIIWAPENTDPWFDVAPLTPWYCLPLVGMTVVGAHRACTRAHRDGVDELLDTCPVAEVTRTYGFLLSAVTPLVTSFAFLGIGAALLAVRDPHIYGSLAARDWADVAAALLLGVGAVALGVGVGRWLRFSLAPIVAVVAVGFLGGAISGIGGHDWNPYSTLAMSPTIEWDSPVFQARPAGWHLLWVLGLTVLVALGAVARHRRDRVVRVLAIATVGVVAIAGVGATRPMPAAAAQRIARAVADPAAVQECTTTAAITVCLFPVHRPAGARILEELAPLAAVLPAGAGEWTLRQRYDADLADLPPEVRRLLAPGDLEVPIREVAIAFEDDHLVSIGSVSHQLALGSVGLPDEADERLLPAVAAGQARGVVALWLATRGKDAKEIRELTTSPLPRSSDPFDRGSLEEGDCSVPAVVWSAQDLAAARALVALPAAAVTAVLDTGWTRWTDPQTGTDELLGALGLPPVGPFDSVVARPGDPC
jgi:hypothetical protein